MAKNKRRGHFYLVLLIAYLTIMVYRVVLSYIIGSKGLTYFSFPNELFLLIAGAFNYGICESSGTLIANRVERGQYYNSGLIFRSGVFISAATGVLVSLLMLIFGKGILSFFNLSLSFMAYMITVPAIFLIIVSGALNGYCKGHGYKYAVSLSYIVFIISYIVFGIIFSLLCQKQGNKVSALLRVDDYRYSYGAMGAAIGLLIAAVISFSYSLFMYFMAKNGTRYSSANEYTRSIESVSTGIKLVLKNALAPVAIWIAVYSITVTDELVVFLDKNKLTSMDFTFGEFYGKSFPIPVIIGLIVLVANYKNVRKTLSHIFREEYRHARENLKNLVHRMATYGFFLCAMIIVLSDNILSSLFASNGQDASGFMCLCALVMSAGLFAIIFLKLLVSVGYNKLASIICLISMVVHIVLTLIFSKSFGLLISGFIISDIMMMLMIAAACFYIVSKRFQYTQEWFRSVTVSLISAVGSGIIGLLINKMLSPIIGKLAAIVLVLVFSTIIYMIMLLILRGYEEEELEGSILGKVMIFIGYTLHLL